MTSWTPPEPDQHGRRSRVDASGPRADRIPGSHPRPGVTLPTTLTVVPWVPADPGVPAARFPASHPYVELLWTPVLGPTQVILLRRLADVAVAGGGQVDVVDLAVAIGSSTRGSEPIGTGASVGRAVDRLARFRLVARPSSATLAVVTHVPPLPDRDLRRLPVSFQALHQALVDELGRAS